MLRSSAPDQIRLGNLPKTEEEEEEKEEGVGDVVARSLQVEGEKSTSLLSKRNEPRDDLSFLPVWPETRYLSAEEEYKTPGGLKIKEEGAKHTQYSEMPFVGRVWMSQKVKPTS